MKRITALLVICLFAVTGFAQSTADKMIAKSETLLQESHSLWENGQIEDALGLNVQAIECLNDVAGGANMQGAQARHLYGFRLMTLDRNKEAAVALQGAYDMWRKAGLSITTDEECNILKHLVECCYYIKDYEQAEKYGELFLIKTRRLYNKMSDEYAYALYLNGLILLEVSRHAEAKKCFDDFLVIRVGNDKFDDSKRSDIKAFERSGICAYECGNFEEAKRMYCIADSLYSLHEEFHDDRITLLHRLATTATRLGEMEEAASYLDDATCLTEKYGEENEELQLSNASNRAVNLIDTDPKAAAEIFSSIVTRYIEIGQESTSRCAAAKANLAYCTYLCGNHDVSIKLFDESIATMDQLGIPDPDLYYQSRMLQIMVLKAAHKNHDLTQRSLAFSAYLSDRITRNFPKMTELERGHLWKQVEDWYNQLLPFLALESRDATMKRLCYDGVLQSRGILLNSSTNIEKMVQNSEDDSLIEMYAQMLYARREGQQQIARNLEHRILKQLPAHGDFMSDITISSDSVLAHLGPKDIAIEFLVFENMDDEDSTYVALTLRPGYKAPRMTYLCNNRQLASVIARDQWQNIGQALYDAVWKKLEIELHGVTRILFAVDGELQRVPIEYCNKAGESPLYDRYECYRLSSTRQIVKQHKPHTAKAADVVLYGNINYNATFDQLRTANAASVHNMVYTIESDTCLYELEDDSIWYDDFVYADTLLCDSVAVHEDALLEELDVTPLTDAHRGRTAVHRGAFNVNFPPLPATKMEIADIETILRKQDKVPHIFSENEATEESVKELSGRDIGIMHFATHGFFLPPDAEDDSFNFLDIDAEADTERAALSRSALVLAGANNIFSEEVPWDLEDGYLTAYDLSTMNFDKTDLVVMSACESGLGDVSSEGVFGLQRGFKKAGAGSILMSLSKVNDYATMLFMKEFYRSYLRDSDKRKALKQAQHLIRTTEGGRWNEPRFWAPFILLDGFDGN